ncbi:MAG: hypothetical protein ACYS8X_13425 [Planctomycetota bacterium]
MVDLGKLRALFLLVVVVSLVMLGCRARDGKGHVMTDAKALLRSVCKIVSVVEYTAGESAPMTLPALIAWIEEHGFEEESYVDYPGRTITDSWGNAIIVLAEDGEFVGVGSSGPNGIWEHGRGDDLTSMLDDL